MPWRQSLVFLEGHLPILDNALYSFSPKLKILDRSLNLVARENSSWLTFGYNHLIPVVRKMLYTTTEQLLQPEKQATCI